ncbi:V3 protein [Myrica rubra citlodavirus 1]|nr:V3 protein [Myrica rubra citlodavirus 1]
MHDLIEREKEVLILFFLFLYTFAVCINVGVLFEVCKLSTKFGGHVMHVWYQIPSGRREEVVGHVSNGGEGSRVESLGGEGLGRSGEGPSFKARI